jgi:hypothetical protein
MDDSTHDTNHETGWDEAAYRRAVADGDWRRVGARHRNARRRGDGKGTWTLRPPRSSAERWTISASHAPYLGRPPYDHGDDAWRISIVVPRPSDGAPVEAAFCIAGSEADALAAVEFLAAAGGSR